MSVYPLKLADEEYSPKEANYEQTFFNAKGEFLDALKTVLPMIFLDWANEIPLRYRQAVGVLAGNQTRMPQLLVLRLMKQDAAFCEWVL